MELLENPLFQGISEFELEQMRHCFDMQYYHYKEKQEIDIQGKVGILLSGCVSLNRLHKDGDLDMLEYIKSGGIFGTFFSPLAIQECLIVICEQECTVVCINNEHITKRCARACLHHSMVVENLLSLMTTKVQQLSEKIEILSHRTIREKLMCYFHIQRMTHNSNTFLLPFSFGALANYICVDRSAMTRELRKMKQEQLIQITGRTVTIPFQNQKDAISTHSQRRRH